MNCSRAALISSIFAGLFLVVSGCGGSTATTAPAQDEMTKYLDEHPELKNVKEDTVTSSGGT